MPLCFLASATCAVCAAQEVAVARYRTFIQVAGTLDKLKAEAEHMQSHCSSLQKSLPSLSAAADAFAQRASDLASRRAGNKQLLSECALP